MKKIIITWMLVMVFSISNTIIAQNYQEESLGLPGDNLNLYAVMTLFQESETLEAFERDLNAQNSRINNLDLDGDRRVDYIRVIDNVDRNVHYIVLQVAVNSRENQDVAVFTVVREHNGQVQIQLIGDEALYGRDYIIEPFYDDDRGQTPNPGYMGNARAINGQQVVVNRTTTVEIAAWPVIRFIFLPTYVVWHSPWYYSYYPSYWRPWQPFYWHYYYGYHYHNYAYYYGHYRPVNYYRYTNWNNTYYSSRRSYSVDVNSRIQRGDYKTTYSRPEQRRAGEALYVRTQRRQPTTTGTVRQSTTTGTIRQSTSTGAVRQQSTTGTSRQQTTTGTVRQQTTTGNSQVGRRSSSEQNTGTSQPARKSTATGVSRSEGRSSRSTQSTTTGKSATSTSESKTVKGTGRR